MSFETETTIALICFIFTYAALGSATTLFAIYIRPPFSTNKDITWDSIKSKFLVLGIIAIIASFIFDKIFKFLTQ